MSFGFMPAYASSLLGNIDKFTQQAKLMKSIEKQNLGAGGFSNDLMSAALNLKGIKGAEGVMQDLLSSATVSQGFIDDPTGNPLAQSQQAFGMDPFSLFNSSGLLGGLANFGIAPNLGNLGAASTLGQFGEFNNGFANLFTTNSQPDPIQEFLSQWVSSQNFSPEEQSLLKQVGLSTITRPKGVIANTLSNGIRTEGSGDPHFYVDGKLMYDFQGESGKYFNILSDGDEVGEETFVNAKFEGENGVTVMTEVGILAAGKTISTNLKGEATLDDKPIDQLKPEDLEWDTTIPGKTGDKVLRAKVEWDKEKKTLVVNTGEYKIHAIAEPGAFKLNIENTEAGYAANGDIAGGVQGEMFDPEQQQKIKDFLAGKATYKTGKGAQGEGFLLHTMDKYVVKDLFSTQLGFKRKKTKTEYGKQLDLKTGAN